MKQDWLDSFRLDDDAGPAAPLDPKNTDALATQAVERALSAAGGSVATRLNQSWWRLAAVGIGGAVLALGAYSVSRPVAPSPVVAASPISVTPAATADTPIAPTTPTELAPIETVAVTSLPNAAPAATAPSKAPETKTASDLLAEANHARRQSDWAEAAALYDRVMRSQADESYAATVALASLRLEHFGDPRGALALYERALAARPGGALTTQAEAGAERCRSALGEPASAQ